MTGFALFNHFTKILVTHAGSLNTLLQLPVPYLLFRTSFTSQSLLIKNRS